MWPRPGGKVLDVAMEDAVPPIPKTCCAGGRLRLSLSFTAVLSPLSPELSPGPLSPAPPPGVQSGSSEPDPPPPDARAEPSFGPRHNGQTSTRAAQGAQTSGLCVQLKTKWPPGGSTIQTAHQSGSTATQQVVALGAWCAPLSPPAKPELGSGSTVAETMDES
jgi:hypothetical protein